VAEINTTWCQSSNPFSHSLFFTTHTRAWGIDYWLAWERQHRVVDSYSHSCSAIFVSSILWNALYRSDWWVQLLQATFRFKQSHFAAH
jgi:hypothetical protein